MKRKGRAGRPRSERPRGTRIQGTGAFPAVFLDRDGTLNVEKDYVSRLSDWEWIPGAVEGLQRLAKMGYKLVVVSNQSGVARGYYTCHDVDRLHRQVADGLRAQGVRVDGFYYCPHSPEGGCDCRKPAPGLILRAARDLGIDLARSFMVGDKAIDAQAGLRAGVTPVLVETGYGKTERAGVPAAVRSVPDLLSLALWFERKRKGVNT